MNLDTRLSVQPAILLGGRPTSPRQRRKILVADDDDFVREIFCRALAGCGCDVDSASDGQEAWDALLHERYDALVTDHEMPRLAGLPLVERLRLAGITVPVFIVSGSCVLGTPDDYPHLSIAAILPKPLSSHELVAAVNQVLPLTPTVRPGVIREVAQALREAKAVGAWPDESQRSPARTLPVAPRPGSNAIRLPMLPADDRREPAPGPAPRRQPAAPRRSRVLLVEDDAVVRASLNAVLESEGFEVDEADNGAGAVARAAAEAPDLVLLDLNMPRMDGWEAFAKIDRIQPLVPVIVITARPHQYKVAVQHGVDAFMEKPLNIPVLVSAIKMLTAEDENRHTRRITNPAFVTRLLARGNG